MKINRYAIVLFSFVLMLMLGSTLLSSASDQREFGLWGLIDDSVLVFILISIPFFMVLIAHKVVGEKVRKAFRSRIIKDRESSAKAIKLMLHPLYFLLLIYDQIKSLAVRVFSIPPLKYFTLFVFAVGLIFVLSINNFINWYPYTTLGSITRNTILIVGIIAIYNISLELGWLRSQNFWKSELSKFVLLIFGSFFCLIVSNTLGIEVDKLIYLDVETSAEQNKNVVIMGFVLSFSLANLMNNVTVKKIYG